MSIFQEARVTVLLADYIGIDAGGKVNALGAGFEFMGSQPNGVSAPHCVIAMISVPAKFAGQQFSLSMDLQNETTGQPVMVPTSPETNEPLVIQQVATVQMPQIPGLYIPGDAVMARMQMPLAFMDGLPLANGNRYRWRVQIDGQTNPAWTASFYVPGPPPQPVFGGLAGPADIPNIAPPHSPPTPG